MEQNKKKRLRIILVIVGTFFIGSVAFLFCYHVSQTRQELIVELGDELSTDLHDYISGQEWSIGKAKLDISRVDTSLTGTYEAYVEHGFQNFTYQIIVDDTTAPAFTEKEEQIYLKEGEVYDFSFFYEELYDYSGEISVSADGFQEDEISFSEIGKYEIRFTATDASSNCAELIVSVLVDTAPVISNIPEFYVVQGENVDLLEGVVATDAVDGDVTDRLRVDYGDFSWNSLGTHEITFEATDNYGLITREPVVIHICEEKEICDKISNREISWRDYVISKVPNYYEGGAQKMESLEDQMEYMLPCVIHIDTDYHTSTVKYVHGSGFILHMDDEFIYLCSNEHVLSYTEQGTAYFYDGASAPYEVMGLNADEDVGIARIAKADVPEDTLYTLFSVHISKEAYDHILTDHETRLFMEITTDKGLDYTKSGVSVEENDDFYIVNEDCLEVTIRMKAGNSGSAIIDEYGNLIGMCVGLRYDPDEGYRYFCIPLQCLISNYETLSGNYLYR